MNKQFYVYIHFKPDGTPFYVGKGCERRGYRLDKRNSYYKNTINKYGRENIQIEVFNCISEEKSFEEEKEFIKLFRREGFKLCNLTDGGEIGSTGYKHSEENRKKISEALKGRVVSEKARVNMSKAKKGHIISEEAKRKMSIAKIGKYLGRKHSEETKKKISESKKGHVISDETR